MNLQLLPTVSAEAENINARYQTTIRSEGHTLIADEPVSSMGTDTGMNPYSLLLASLGSCTAITLRMYIDRKMWIVENINVNVELFEVDGATLIKRQLSFEGELSDEQEKRLEQIADACPIHKMLTGKIIIETALR